MIETVSSSSMASIVKAHRALAKSDLPAARAVLDEAKRTWPDDAEVMMLEARVVEAEGTAVSAPTLYRRAATALEAAFKEKPNGHRATALANALCKCGELDAALSALDEAARLGAPEEDILRARRAIAFARKDLAGRRRAAEAVVGLEGRADVWDWVQLAIACRDLAETDAAAAAAARALALDPHNAQAARIAAWAVSPQADAGDPAKARASPKPSTAPVAGLMEWIVKSQKALAKRDAEGARAALEEAQNLSANDPSVLMLEARVVESEGGLVEAASLYRGAADALAASLKQTPNADRAVALANALCKCGDLDEAQTALEAAARLGAAKLNILRAERSLAFARGDMAAMRRISEAIVETGDRVDVWDWVNLAIACRHLDDTQGAADAAAKALELDPVNLEAARISSWTAVRQGDGQRAVSELRRVAAISPDDPRSSLQLARALSLSGRAQESAQEIGRALERWPNDSSIRAFALANGFRTVDQIPERPVGQGARDFDHFREMEIRRLAAVLPSSDALRRPVVVNDLSEDVIIGEARGSQKLVLVFTALNDAVNMPIVMFDRYLAALGVSAIYLKDFNRLFHLGGVKSLGDSYEATIAALRDLSHRMQVRNVYCIGTSAGGFAAVRYGAELQAERVVSFAGQSFDPVREFSRLELGLTLIRRRRTEIFPAHEMDLAAFLRSRRLTTRFELFYPEGAPRDVEQAKHMEGIEGVTLHPVAGCDNHELLRWMAVREDIGARLAGLLDV